MATTNGYAGGWSDWADRCDRAALAVARDLIEAGVPVFAAPQVMDNRGYWDPDGGVGGYRLPKGWESTEPDLRWLGSHDRGWRSRCWRRGWALCAVMGHKIDLVDVDPRSGGDDSRATLIDQGVWPRSYGVANTPSGGWHEFVAPLGIRSRDAIRPGIDVKSGSPQGAGRGFAFIAPTAKRSKTNGDILKYVWDTFPDLAAITSEDRSGGPLAEEIARLRDRHMRRRKDRPTDRASGGGSGIPEGDRRRSILSLAGSLRDRSVPFHDAAEQIHALWLRCEQPPAASQEFSEGEARSLLEDVYSRYEPSPPIAAATPPARRIVLSPASSITPRPVLWAWDTSAITGAAEGSEGRLPVGALAMVFGHAGVGKSQFAIYLAAAMTTGTLPGEFEGRPRSVIYAATEDSWQMTLVPRLIAAGADLERIFRIEVVEDEDIQAPLTLPKDIAALGDAIAENDIGLVVLDPILSLISAGIDDYRNRQVRTALEPLAAIADRTASVILGIAHPVKAAGSNALLLLSGSNAFGQVVRAVIGCAKDRNSDDNTFVLSTVKSSVGRSDLPSLVYTIEPSVVQTPDGKTTVSKFVLTGRTSERSVEDLLRDAPPARPEAKNTTNSAGEFIRTYLEENGSAIASEVITAGEEAGFKKRTLERAREIIGVTTKQTNGRWLWELPEESQAPGANPPDRSM